MIQLTLTCSSAAHATFVLDAYAGYALGKALAEPEPVPVQAEPAPAPVAPKPAPAPVEPEKPQLTIEQVRQRLMEISKKKNEQVKALLALYEASVVTDLDPSVYGEFMEAAEQL